MKVGAWLVVALSAIALVTGSSADARSSAQPPNTGYRHGLVPQRGVDNSVQTSAANLSYGGGIDGVGVTTETPRVFLVFWGSQWGIQSTNPAGYAVFSGDPDGVAPDLEAFFKGLGTGGERWSGVMTQYCQGVAVGTQTCPFSAAHVAYPTGGALAGVWEDTTAASPAAATGHQLAQEAANAAAHFGNTTSALNRDAQYIVVSPTGADPDNYETQGFCAWHDYTGDTTLDGGGGVTLPGGPIAFTNLPYIPNAGAACGAGFVNPGDALDGVTIVGGHEYAETLTDQFPTGGWSASNGEEDADKCAWISRGQGASQNITLTTGTFAVQSTWANDFNGGLGGCEVSHAIGGHRNTVTVTDPGAQSGTVSAATSLQIAASDSASGQTLTYGATGLPAGLSISSSSGLITGAPTTTGTSNVTVTATDGTGASGNAAFSWTIVLPTVTVTNPGSQVGRVGVAAHVQIAASDSVSTQTLTYNATGLPAGLSISPSTGLITGTPTTAGVANVTVTAADGTGASGSAVFSWTIRRPTVVTVTDPGPQTGRVGVAANLQIVATDSVATQTLTYAAAGLPAGLAISASTGLITGTPTTAGVSSVTVTVTDRTGSSGSAAFTWTVRPRTVVTVTNPGAQFGRVGVAAHLPIVASDSAGGQTLTYGATGLPAGLSISASTGSITGTPTTAGVSSVTVTVTDGTGSSGSATFAWTIRRPTVVTVTNPGAQSSHVHIAVHLQIVATDSVTTQTLTYHATGLPAGLSISSSTGLITGTPTTAGGTSVTVTVTDGTGSSGSVTFAWTVL